MSRWMRGRATQSYQKSSHAVRPSGLLKFMDCDEGHSSTAIELSTLQIYIWLAGYNDIDER